MSPKGQQPIMKKLLALSIAAVMCLGITGHALAGANPNINLAVDVLVKAKTRSPGNCNGMPVYSSCSVINQVGAPTTLNQDVIFVAYHFAGLTAIEFGVDWGSTSFAYGPVWTKCSDLEISRVGTTDISAALAWNNCTANPDPEPGTGGLVVGWMRMTLYSGPGVYHIKASDRGNLYSVDCAFQFDDLHTVHDGFSQGAVPGPGSLPPCSMGPTATETTTWSGVKALYR
jgi:hypothetical protein